MADTRRRRKSRVRYDRIFIVAVIFVIIIFLFKSCLGKDDKKAKKASTDNSALSSEESTVDNSGAVFLSPSNQSDNAYAAGGSVTEASAMRSLSESIKKVLEDNGITVYIAGPEDTLEQKVNTANDLGVGVYVAVHSNAGGDSGGGEGTECFYNPDTRGSKTLAEYVYNKVAELTPTEDRGLKGGTEEEHYLYEVDHPDMANCLLEVEFHDTQKHAQWILDNEKDIANCIADGIMKYLGKDSVQNTGASEESSEESASDE